MIIRVPPLMVTPEIETFTFASISKTRLFGRRWIGSHCDRLVPNSIVHNLKVAPDSDTVKEVDEMRSSTGMIEGYDILTWSFICASHYIQQGFH